MASTINSSTSNGIVITPDTSGEIELQANGVTKAKITANGLQDANGASLRGGSFRNLIINGDMQIAQRGTSASGITTTGYYTCDRWETNIQTGGTWTMSQDSDVPSGQGFASSMKFACTTANASLSTNSQMRVGQHIEAQNLQHLAFATVNAKKITFSFWVKSNKTGTYNAWTTRQDSGRMSSKQFTISSADAWEKKTLTFDGDTTGTIANDNGRGMEFNIVFAAGTDYTSGTSPNGTWQDLSGNNPNRYVGNVNLADSTSNYINITGVQLEVGSGASDFEFLPYDVQLSRCQRYYEKSYNISQSAGTSTANGQEYFQVAGARSTNYGLYTTHYKVPKRASCTVTLYSQSGTSGYLSNGDSGANLGTGGVLFNGSENMFVSKNTGSTIADGTVIAYQWTAESEL